MKKILALIITVITIIVAVLFGGCATLEKARDYTLDYNQATGEYTPSMEAGETLGAIGGTLGAFGVPYVGAAGVFYNILTTGLAFYYNRKSKIAEEDKNEINVPSS